MHPLSAAAHAITFEALLALMNPEPVVEPPPRRLPRRHKSTAVPNWIHRRYRPTITADALRHAHVALDAAAKARRAERAARKHPQRHVAPIYGHPEVVSLGYNLAG